MSDIGKKLSIVAGMMAASMPQMQNENKDKTEKLRDLNGQAKPKLESVQTQTDAGGSYSAPSSTEAPSRSKGAGTKGKPTKGGGKGVGKGADPEA